MANPNIELDPVTHITAGALGKPGHRVFYIQAEKGAESITLVCDKEQVAALVDAIDEMVQNLEEEFSVMRHGGLKVDEAAMAIKEPVDPLFRVDALGLGYDATRDRLLLVAQEALAEDEERDPREVRFFATRAQMQVLSAYAREVVGKGRPPEQVVLQAEAYVRRNGHSE